MDRNLCMCEASVAGASARTMNIEEGRVVEGREEMALEMDL